MDDEWGELAASWDVDPNTRRYAELAFGSLCDLLAQADRSLPGSRVLDFGCGTGLLTEHLASAGATVHAFDTSVGMLEVLERKATAGALPGATILGDIPDVGDTYDMVVCSSVCAFLDDYPGAVRDLVGTLREGGLLVQWDWERHDTESGSHGLLRHEIAQALEGAGLVGVQVSPSFEIEVAGVLARPLLGYGFAEAHRRAGQSQTSPSSSSIDFG
ncbi:MAG: class I SAM-dependent methyltransferase [Actinobacteria bacterium]|nr:class I SAM-dependent methyltransferase [Actinomycetota bacterium]